MAELGSKVSGVWRDNCENEWRHAHFGFERGLKPGKCEGAWHARCYRRHVNDSFPVCQREMEDGQPIDETRWR